MAHAIVYCFSLERIVFMEKCKLPIPVWEHAFIPFVLFKSFWNALSLLCLFLEGCTAILPVGTGSRYVQAA